MPFCVAISGGIASGKSTVCRQLAQHGITVVDADIVARELVAPGQPALQDIAEQLGSRFIQADGTLDRAALRAHAFENQEAKQRLENILHPRIQTELAHQSQQAESPYVAVAIPLLNPASRKSAYAWLHRVLIVEAPKELQIARISARDGSSPDLAKAMISAQLSYAERLPMADDVLINDASVAFLTSCSDRLHERYLGMVKKNAPCESDGAFLTNSER
jgi:dephospho-CoA kinase